MVHQLSLVSSIPHSSYIQTVSSLRALTGLSLPQEVATYTLLTRPHDVFKPKFEPGKVNQIEQYYMKCTTTWEDDVDISQPVLKDLEILVNKLFTDDNVQKHWTLQIADIPNAGKNAVSAQNIHESTLVHHHTKVVEQSAEVKLEDTPKKKDSFLQFVDDLGYDVVNQYWTKGVRFFHGDIIIELYKVFVRDDSPSSNSDKLRLKLLDESNTFQVKAYINFPKLTDVEQITKGTKELVKLQSSFENLFKLEVPDRMFMDSRIKRV